MLSRLPRISVILAVSLLMILAAATVPQASAESGQELKHDDGSAEKRIRWRRKVDDLWGPAAEPGWMFAVQFDIPEVCAKVVGVKYYVDEPEPFKVRVFDAERNPLPLDLEVEPAFTGWFSVDLSQYGIFVQERFYVALEYLPEVGVTGKDGGSLPWLLTDTNMPKGFSWDVTPGDWTKEEESNYMIRATIQTVPSYMVTLDSLPRFAEFVVDGIPYTSNLLPLSFKWCEGSNHTIQVNPLTVDVSEDMRYAFMKWDDGSNDSLRTITVERDTDLLALYELQYLLTITSLYGETEGAGWHWSGSTATFSLNPTAVEHGNRTRHVFAAWGGNLTSYSPSDSIVMDGPRAIVARWNTQYLLTVEYSLSEIGSPEGGGWKDADTTLSLSTVPVIPIDETSRYACAGHRIDNEPLRPDMELSITMDQPHMLSWQFHRQFHVDVASSYGEADVSGVSLGVDVEGGEWFDKGSVLSVTIQPLVELGNRTRRVFSQWTGTTPSPRPVLELTVLQPQSLRAEWATQYFVVFEFVDPGGEVLLLDTLPEMVLVSPDGEKLTEIDYAGSWMNRGVSEVVQITWEEIDVRPPEFTSFEVDKPGTVSVPILVYHARVKVVDLLGLPVPGAAVEGYTDTYEATAQTGGDGIAVLIIPLGKYTAKVSYFGQTVQEDLDASVVSLAEITMSFTPITIGAFMLGVAAILIVLYFLVRPG